MVGNGLVVLAFILVANAPAAIRLGEVRVQPDGLREVGDGLLDIALLLVGNAPATIRQGQLRVQPDGLGFARDPFVVFAPLM